MSSGGSGGAGGRGGAAGAGGVGAGGSVAAAGRGGGGASGGTSGAGTAGASGGTSGVGTAGTVGSAGTTGQSGRGGATAGAGGTPGTPSCIGMVTVSSGMEPANGVPCSPGVDIDVCYRTCGPEKAGYKSETCTTALSYQEMSGCLFDQSKDYSCYKIPNTANTACPSGTTPKNSDSCDVPTCTVCNSTGGLAGGQYLDSTGAAKSGFCVCQAPNTNGARTWSCAQDNGSWPCPLGGGC